MATHLTRPVLVGGVPLEPGSGGFYGFWTGNAWFVDYDNGNDGYAGDEPTKAFQYLETAENQASAGDVIYIRPRTSGDTLTGTDASYMVPESTVNWSIPRTKHHLSIVGAAPCVGPNAMSYGTYLRGAASQTTGPVMDIRAPFCTIENLAFHQGGATSGGVLRLYGDGSGSHNAYGSSVVNCLFRWGTQSGLNGALHIVDVWYIDVYGCQFYNCYQGIVANASSSTIRLVMIKNCDFVGNDAAIDCDINFYGNATYSGVHGCHFNHDVPALSGGSYTRYINFEGTMDEIMIAGNYFATDDCTVNDEIDQGTGVYVVGNYDDSTAFV